MCLEAALMQKLTQNFLQLLWFLEQIIPQKPVELDLICFGLLRQLPGGCLTPESLELCESLLSMLNRNALVSDRFRIDSC